MFKSLSFSILALLLASPFAMAQGSFTGDWSGALETEGGNIDVVIHITEADEGLAATLDVPQQGATGIAANSVSAEGGELIVEFTDIQTTVTGTKTAEGTIDATWTQRGQEVPLTLSPAEAGGVEAEAAPAEDTLKEEMPEQAQPEEPEAPESMEAPEESAAPENR